MGQHSRQAHTDPAARLFGKSHRTVDRAGTLLAQIQQQRQARVDQASPYCGKEQIQG
jgi:hypothetical protein